MAWPPVGIVYLGFMRHKRKLDKGIPARITPFFPVLSSIFSVTITREG
jgi:hypothetical protein